ncbi:MAG: protein kinase domain-containing protein [Planctomycetota bacterium]|jgi:hypothetical protein
MSLSVGQEFAHYRIVAQLGRGAMGEVYRARDLRLDRDVAVKVLSGDFAEDPQRLSRLEREAKVLASLHHANIGQIHAVEPLGNSQVLVLELVEGEDLSERLLRGPLPVREALPLCAQIAEGLEAAHEAGVIHRDLKPANVRVTPRGAVKVLDFGLAKPVADGSTDRASLVSLTGQGVLVGTPAYMSPEAVRGHPLCRRTDVWAFGCILYECLTGQRAFDAGSLPDMVAAILEREPDLSALPADVPPRVRELLLRCLDKDPRTRLQDMGEARIALRGGGSSATTVIPRPALPGRRPVLPLVLAAAAGAAVTWALLHDLDAEPAWENAIGPTASRWDMLNLPGSEFDVEISTGGETIVFGSNRNGVIDLWRCSLDGGNLENLSQGRYAIDDMPVRNTGMKGNVPVFHHALDVEAKLLAHPGATPELAVGPFAAEPDWTRDGSRVVYHTIEPGDPIYAHGTGQARGEPVIAGAVGEHLHYPTWSFDEQWILYTRGDHLGQVVDLYRVRPDGTDEQQLTHGVLVSFPTPIDERTVLFLALDQQSAGPWLWSLDLPTLRTRRLTVGLQKYTSLAASGDGRTLVATVASPTSSLYSIPIPAEGATVSGEDEVEPVPDVPSLRAVAPRYAGGQLFYLSSLGGGGDGLFMARGGEARALQPDSEEPLIFLPSVSPDARTVALIRPGEAHSRLSLLDVESRSLRVADRVPDLEVRGDSGWDPTAAWIVVGGDGPDGPGLFRVSVADGAWVQLALGQVSAPAWSPTEDLIVYGVHRQGPWYTLRGMRSDGTVVELPGEDAVVRWPGQFRFLPDGSGVVYKTFLQEGRLAKNFELYDLRTGEKRLLTDLQHRGTIRAFDVSPDGKHIVFDRTEDNSDVVVIRRVVGDA